MFKNRWKEKWKRMLGISILMVGLLLPAPASLAADTGSLEIEYLGRTKTDEDIPLSGADFVLYYAASMEDGRWNLAGDFQKADVSLENTESSERKEQAEKLYQYAVKNNIGGSTEETDATGRAQFTNLKMGLYLVAQTEKLQTDAGTFSSAPFLISIPTEEDGTVLWNVVAEPKSEWGDIEQPKPVEPEKPVPNEKNQKTEEENNKADTTKKGNVKTGDTAPIEVLLVALLASAGGAGILIRKRNR